MAYILFLLIFVITLFQVRYLASAPIDELVMCAGYANGCAISNAGAALRTKYC